MWKLVLCLVVACSPPATKTAVLSQEGATYVNAPRPRDAEEQVCAATFACLSIAFDNAVPTALVDLKLDGRKISAKAHAQAVRPGPHRLYVVVEHADGHGSAREIPVEVRSGDVLEVRIEIRERSVQVTKCLLWNP